MDREPLSSQEGTERVPSVALTRVLPAASTFVRQYLMETRVGGDVAEESGGEEMREEVTQNRLPVVRFVTAEERDSLLWQRSLYRAHRILAFRRKRLRSLSRLRDGVADELVGPLASLVAFAESRLACTSDSAVGAVASAVFADWMGGARLKNLDSFIFRVVNTLECLGVREPYDSFMAVLDDSQTELLLRGLCDLTGLETLNPSVLRGPLSSTSYSIDLDVQETSVSIESVPEVLARLGTLQGLGAVKLAFRAIAAREEIATRRAQAGLANRLASRHCVFVGNPGTGKTTVARMLVDVLHASGAMPEAHLVEVTRADLVGDFLGSSALKTRKVVEAALGGVLFIDEAYSLSGTSAEAADRFAQEAVDTLVKMMEDYRDDLVVVLAGYPEEMQRLLAMNPGLVSRFGRTLLFEDLSDTELIRTFLAQVRLAGFEPGPDVEVPVWQALGRVDRGRSFGNARWTRNVVEAAIDAHAARVLGMSQVSVADLEVLTFADVQRAVWSVST